MVENGCYLPFALHKNIKNHGTHAGTTFLKPRAYAAVSGGGGGRPRRVAEKAHFGTGCVLRSHEILWLKMGAFYIIFHLKS